ncbi:DNA-binding domain-containing protein [Aliiroseovarius subalbicans]|uniref:HvfC/BufC N-terminal domain-containing protein n=1 Tax=Aliiroseovarius subalbicans TaxID=2925840 RepID=UPI001F56CD68|nr:DNA-binding domain-containing protein [Aliiroseovarius subalbicans]MCI2397883.1 putative DNA-binding domain-containing protein [Aliiroseovarius subalbicans]
MSVDQTQFRTAMLDPALPVPNGLTDALGAPAGARFNVYRNNVAVSLTEAMEAAFPVILKLVGEEFFRAMAGVYLRIHPPKSPLMMHYGDAFPGFLEGFEPAQHLGYLPDIARLELAMRESYHAADGTPTEPAVLQSLPPDRLMTARIILAPALRLVRSKWPIHGIWAFNMQGAPQPQMQGQDVLITRPDFDPVLTPLPDGGAAFIIALQQGQSFGTALGLATAQAANFDLTTTLGTLISGAAITKISEG